MSTKNFVSYGDAETLMAGVKSAIDDAGGGTVKRLTIAKVTDTTLTIRQALYSLYSALKSSDFWTDNVGWNIEKLQYLHVFFHSTTNGNVFCDTKLNFFNVNGNVGTITLTNLNVNPTSFTSLNSYVKLHSSENSCIGINNSTDVSERVLSQVYIDYIELYYDTVEDITSEVQDELDSLDARVYALEQGGGGSGETVVASYTATAQTNVDAALNAIGQQLNALTLSEHEWSKLVLAMKYGATGEPTYARCCRVSNANFFFSFVDFINNNTMYQVSRTNSGSNFFINGTSMLQDYYISAGGGCTVYY